MKKLTYLLGLGVLAMSIFSCSDDENATPPSLAISSANPVTVAPNGTFTVKWRADAGDAKLTTFTILEGNSAVHGWDDAEIESANNETYIDSTSLTVGTENTTFTLIVTDKDGEEAEATLTVEVDESISGTAIKTYTGITIGSISYNTTDPGYYAASANKTFKYNDSGVEASDFGYMYGSTATNKATIFAPTWSSVQTLNQGPKSWSAQRATKFKTTTLTTTEFNEIGDEVDSDDVIEKTAAGASAEYVNHLEVGGANENVDVIAFITEDGKKGLIKISSITGTTKGTISFDVKIQQ